MERFTALKVEEPVDCGTVFDVNEIEAYMQDARNQSIRRQMQIRENVLQPFFYVLEDMKVRVTVEENKVLMEVQNALLRLKSQLTNQVREQFSNNQITESVAEPQPQQTKSKNRPRISAFEPIIKEDNEISEPAAQVSTPNAEDTQNKKPFLNVNGFLDIFRRTVPIGKSEKNSVAI